MPGKLNFLDAKDLFQQAADMYSKRKTIFEKQERMFFLQDPNLPTADHIRQVFAPDPRNYILGATRLMTATRPQWRVSRLLNEDNLKKNSSQIERVCDAINFVSGTIANRPIEVEAALSAFLYGEVQIKIINTAALVKNAKGEAQERAKEINKRTPLLFQIVNPKVGYPLYDVNGQYCYCSEEKVSVAFVRSKYGENLYPDKKPTDTVQLRELWNDKTVMAWDDMDNKLWDEENKTGSIPVVSEIVEGSDFFVDENQPSRQPLLYTYAQSGLWEAQNLALTIMTSLALSAAATPMMVFTKASPNDVAEVKNDRIPWGEVTIPPGAKYESLIKQVIDPSIMKINEIAEQKGMESAIYRTAFGEPLGNNAPFSMVSLLSSQGRQPLIPYQRCINHIMGKAMYIGLQMLRAGGIKNAEVDGPNGVVSMDFTTLPEQFVLECTLQISVPQNERENVAIAVQATQGERPLVSLEWAREHWFNISQSDVMTMDIMEEKELFMMHQIDLEKKLSEAKAGGGTGGGGNQAMPTNDGTTSPEAVNGVPGLAMTTPKGLGTLGKNENGVR